MKADDKADKPLSPPKIKHKYYSADDIYQLNSKLQKIRTNWMDSSRKLNKLIQDFNAFILFHETELRKSNILPSLNAFLRDKRQEEKSKELNKVKEDLRKDKSKEAKQLKVTFALDNEPEEVKEEKANVSVPPRTAYERKKIEVYMRAKERVTQQENDFELQKNNIVRIQHTFENFHDILQEKIKHMKPMTADVFCNFEENERNLVLAEILLTAEQCYLEKKCGELYDEVIRNNNVLRITYGFPEKPKPEDEVDEIEKKFTKYKGLCDKLNYSLY